MRVSDRGAVKAGFGGQERRRLLMLVFALARRLRAAALQLAGEETTDREFAEGARREIALAHAEAACLGRSLAGARANPALMTAIGRAEAELDAAYLMDFTVDLVAGRYDEDDAGEAGLGRRAMLYAKRLRGTANRAWAGVQVSRASAAGPPKQGLAALWVLGAAEHCGDCIEEAGEGWRPLGDLSRYPGDGQTACLSNCKCHLLLSDGSQGF